MVIHSTATASLKSGSTPFTRGSAISCTYFSLISMPMKCRPSLIAISPVVPLPKNGSNTISPFLLPAKIQVLGNSVGKVAKCAPSLNALALYLSQFYHHVADVDAVAVQIRTAPNNRHNVAPLNNFVCCIFHCQNFCVVPLYVIYNALIF